MELKGTRAKVVCRYWMALLITCWSWHAVAASDSFAGVIEDAERIVLAMAEEEALVGGGFTLYYQGEVASRSFGSRSADGKDEFTPDTRTALHELAQPLTALAVLQLSERGLVDLDQSINHWFPAFAPWSPDESGYSPTVRQLLSHHSGLPAYFAPGSGRENHGLDTRQFAWEGLVNNSETMAFVAEPGSVYEYSYLGYSLLGSLVETVSGMDYQTYIRANILQPLGMNDTVLVADPDTVVDISPAFIEGETAPHRKFRDIPAAGLVSTLSDMGRLMGGFLEGDNLAGPGSREAMFSVQNARVPQDSNFEIGLGWFISPVTGGTFRNGGTVSHASTDGIARSYLLLYPARKFGVLIATNSRLSSVKLRDTSDRIMELMLGQDPGYAPQPWASHAATGAGMDHAELLEGTYSGPGGLFRIETTRKGLELDVPYLPFLDVKLLAREAGYFGVDIRLLGFLNVVGRFSQVRLLSDSLEGKVEILDGRKLINWYWRGTAAVTLTELPERPGNATLESWQESTGDYQSAANGGDYRLAYDEEHGVFTLGVRRRGFRLFQDPPDLYCPVSTEVMQTCGMGLVGNGTRNLLRKLGDGRILTAYGETLVLVE
jgi:CubicO group peptidase (beta-lactamase class C family)